MAEALLRHRFGNIYEVFSAGVDVNIVDPSALKVLEEIDVDVSGLRSKSVDEFIDEGMDLVVTVCDNARESCPILPGNEQVEHIGFRDPPNLVSRGMDEMEAFRMIRDDILAWIEERFKED